MKIEKETKVVILQNGNAVMATQYVNGKKVNASIARCCPEDAFDFMTGAKIAMDRLTAEQDDTAVDEIQVGDRVKIVDGSYTYPSDPDWIIKNALEYAVYYVYNDYNFVTGHTGKVVAKAPLGDSKRMLYLVQIVGEACYLMGAEGIVKLEE